MWNPKCPTLKESSELRYNYITEYFKVIKNCVYEVLVMTRENMLWF